MLGHVVLNGVVIRVNFTAQPLTREQCEQAKRETPKAVRESWGQNITFTVVRCQ